MFRVSFFYVAVKFVWTGYAIVILLFCFSPGNSLASFVLCTYESTESSNAGFRNLLCGLKYWMMQTKQLDISWKWNKILVYCWLNTGVCLCDIDNGSRGIARMWLLQEFHFVRIWVTVLKAITPVSVSFTEVYSSDESIECYSRIKM